MTSREPDRFDTQARAMFSTPCPHNIELRAYGCVPCLAAALRAAESSALERAAQRMLREADFPPHGHDSTEAETAAWHAGCNSCADIARALIPPAAAPAAECTDHWHCDPATAAHACKANRAAPCPTCRAAPAAEPDVCVGSERIGGYLVPKYAPAADQDEVATFGAFGHGEPAAATGKAEGAEAPDLRRVVERAQVELNRRDERIAELERKARAWSDAIEYCEEMFSPEWLADRRNRSIFAAHIYRLLNAARAAPPKEPPAP